MSSPSLVMYDEELARVRLCCETLVREVSARAALLLDANGQFIVSAGDTSGLDVTSIASLTAGTVAATTGLARLVGEEHFPQISHEGQTHSLHIALVGPHAILVVWFGRESPLGLVRLRAKRCCDRLFTVFTELGQAHQAEGTSPLFAEMTEADIDKLFGR